MLRARPRAIVILLASAVILSGCGKTASQLGLGSNLRTASTTPVSYEALADLGDKWRANPTDVNKGLAYADGLESLGQKDEALGVYQSSPKRTLRMSRLPVSMAASWSRPASRRQQFRSSKVQNEMAKRTGG
jgi:hypothetical protein